MQRVLAIVLGIVSLGPLAAHAGYLIADQNGEQVLLSTGRLKMAPKSAGGLVMVLDVGRGRVWIADPGQKRYWEGTVEEFCDGVRKLSAQGEGSAAGRVPKVTVRKTSDMETVAGLATRKYQV